MLPEPEWVEGLMGRLSSFAQQIIAVLEYLEVMKLVYDTVAVPILRNMPAGQAVAIMPSVIAGAASAIIPGFSEGGEVDINAGIKTPYPNLNPPSHAAVAAAALTAAKPAIAAEASSKQSFANRRQQNIQERRKRDIVVERIYPWEGSVDISGLVAPPGATSVVITHEERVFLK